MRGMRRRRSVRRKPTRRSFRRKQIALGSDEAIREGHRADTHAIRIGVEPLSRSSRGAVGETWASVCEVTPKGDVSAGSSPGRTSASGVIANAATTNHTHASHRSDFLTRLGCASPNLPASRPLNHQSIATKACLEPARSNSSAHRQRART